MSPEKKIHMGQLPQEYMNTSEEQNFKVKTVGDQDFKKHESPTQRYLIGFHRKQ